MGEHSKVELYNTEDVHEPRLNADGEPYPPITVWVNAGYDQGSYACQVQPNGMMTLPDGLIRELSIEVGDDIEWNLDDDSGTIFVKVIRQPWKAPDWIVNDNDEE